MLRQMPMLLLDQLVPRRLAARGFVHSPMVSRGPQARPRGVSMSGSGRHATTKLRPSFAVLVDADNARCAPFGAQGESAFAAQRTRSI